MILLYIMKYPKIFRFVGRVWLNLIKSRLILLLDASHLWHLPFLCRMTMTQCWWPTMTTVRGKAGFVVGRLFGVTMGYQVLFSFSSCRKAPLQIRSNKKTRIEEQHIGCCLLFWHHDLMSSYHQLRLAMTSMHVSRSFRQCFAAPGC